MRQGGVGVGVEITEQPVDADTFADMEKFVRSYLQASVENEDEGGRMRWYPWHSATYRFNHIQNVVDLGERIAKAEGASVDVVRVSALFHDIAKLEADQDVHAEAGASVAREYLDTQTDLPQSFTDQVCRAVAEHSAEERVDDVSLETQSLMEADLLDKVGANGVVLILLRMGYEARTHMDAGEMIDRVLQRGQEKVSLVESETAKAIGQRRLKRTRWICEWLEDEIANMEPPEKE